MRMGRERQRQQQGEQAENVFTSKGIFISAVPYASSFPNLSPTHVLAEAQAEAIARPTTKGRPDCGSKNSRMRSGPVAREL